MYNKLFFALSLLGASAWGLSQLLPTNRTPAHHTPQRGELRCEIESVSLRAGEVIDLPSGNYLSFTLRAPRQGQWLPINLQVQSPNGEVTTTFSELLREGSLMTLGSPVVGPKPISIRCSL